MAASEKKKSMYTWVFLIKAQQSFNIFNNDFLVKAVVEIKKSLKNQICY